MAYDDVRTYQGSEWAARRWDWFNEGRLVEPLSFCQFWRTVVVWASIKWITAPLFWLDDVVDTWLEVHILSKVPSLRIPWRLALLPLKGCWLILREGARGLWRLTYPLRCAARPVGGAALASAVNTGERIEAFIKRHEDGLEALGGGVVVLVVVCTVVLVSVVLLLASWFWTLVAIGALIAAVMVGFACYGIAKSGALRLLGEAAVVVHHGICPPIRIVR